MNQNQKVFQCLTLISQFAIHMLVPIFMCSYFGYLLDEKLNTSFWFIVLFFVGALAGGRNVYRLARKIAGGNDKMPSKLYGSNKKEKRKDAG